MGRSVPPIAARSTWRSTPSAPTGGVGTSSSHRPGSGFNLTRAFTSTSSRLASGDDAERAPDLGEGGDRLVDLGVAMRGTHLGADPGLAARHYRKGEPHHIDAALDPAIGHQA